MFQLGRIRTRNVILLGAFFAGVAAIVFASNTYRRHAAVIDRAHESARHLSAVLAENTARSLEGIDRVLHNAMQIRERYLDGRLSTAQSIEALRRLKASSPLVSALGWTDINGDLVVHTYDG